MAAFPALRLPSSGVGSSAHQGGRNSQVLWSPAHRAALVKFDTFSHCRVFLGGDAVRFPKRMDITEACARATARQT
jgi:hypothetical protein